MAGVMPLTTAVTLTEVATVPALTCVCTSPLASLVAEVDDNATPPTDVFSEKFTVAPGRAPLVLSNTLKTTVETSGRFASPVPCRAMLVGVADINAMEPTDAGATVMVPVADNARLLTVVVAVTKSAPLHPLATYVAVAKPVVVVTLALGCISAVPAAMHGELKPMDTLPENKVP